MDKTQVKKVCAKCGEVKPLDAFYRSDRGYNGRRAVCIECTKAAMKEARLKKKLASPPQPQGKKGRPSVSESRSQAARRAHENKRQRPTLERRNIYDIICKLEMDVQPWMLMKYPFKVRGLAELGGICYEVIIWQTIESEHGYALLECDTATAQDIIKKFGLRERKRYKEQGCTIWAKNDALQEMHRRFVRQRDVYSRKSKAARDLYASLEENKWMFTPEEYQALRDKAADAEQDFIVKRNEFVAEYPQKNGIIIYNL